MILWMAKCIPRVIKPICDGLQFVVWECVFVVPVPTEFERFNHSLCSVLQPGILSLVNGFRSMKIDRVICRQCEC
jgi:hypothetical protein